MREERGFTRKRRLGPTVGSGKEGGGSTTDDEGEQKDPSGKALKKGLVARFNDPAGASFW
jgi:hypothetical protein